MDKHLCEFGCGNPAHYQVGKRKKKWCCSENIEDCFAVINTASNYHKRKRRKPISNREQVGYNEIMRSLEKPGKTDLYFGPREPTQEERYKRYCIKKIYKNLNLHNNFVIEEDNYNDSTKG